LQGKVCYPKRPEQVEEKKDNNSKAEKKKEKEKFQLTEENKLALTELMGKDNLEKIEVYIDELERFYFFLSFYEI